MIRFLLPLLLLAACTTRQNERLHELFASKNRSKELHQLHLIRESLERDPPGSFSLAFAPLLDERGFVSAYELQLDSLPCNEPFILASFNPLTKAISAHCEFSLQSDGTFSILSKDGSLDESTQIPIALGDLVRGQPIQIAVISKERNTCTRAEVIFKPLEASIDEADFSLCTSHAKGTRFHLTGNRLNPGEFLILSERLGDRIIQHRIRADERGCVDVCIRPLVFGKLGGQTHLSISRADGECLLRYPWGGLLTEKRYQQQIILTPPQKRSWS